MACPSRWLNYVGIVYRRWSPMLLVVPCLCLGSCRNNSVAVIQIVTGDSNEQQISFAPKVAFAEYVELPNGGDELRVSLANYELSCEGYSAVPDGGVLVALTFLLPVGQHPMEGTYPWPGLPNGNKSTDANFELKTPIVLPVIRIGKKGIALLPGGNVDIQNQSRAPG